MFYIFQLLCLLSFFLGDIKANGKLINVADKLMGSKCFVNSVKPALKGLDFECDNVLSPNWINTNSWITNCNPSCLSEELTITFKTAYDVMEICISQPFISLANKVPDVEITWNDQQSYEIKLDPTALIQCFLPKLNYGKQIQNMTFITVHTDKLENAKSAEFLTDISSIENGATCRAKTEYSNLWACHLALDFISSLLVAHQEWSSRCNNGDCIGQFIDVTFKIYDTPVIFCLTNRQSYTQFITKASAKWSSGLIRTHDLGKVYTRFCYNYSSGFVETGVRVSVVEKKGTHSLGFGQLQVFVKNSAEKVYALQGTSDFVYNLPSYIHNNFKAFSFSLYGNNKTSGDNCGDIYITFSFNQTSVFKIFISNIVKSHIVIVDPFAKVYDSIIQQYIKCNEWNDFWITTTNEINRISQLVWRNTNSSIDHNLKINDIDGRTIHLHIKENCTKKQHEYLNDKLISTCVALSKLSNVIYTSTLNDGKLINIASKSNGATCTASSVYTTSIDQKCDYALEPFWINHNDWAATCSSNLDCKASWIKIIFKKAYDVIQVCVVQRVVAPANLLRKIEIKIGNNPIKIYNVNLIETCLLLEDGIGSSASEIELEPKEFMSASSINTGFNSISVFAYEEDSSVEKGSDIFVNIADYDLGATSTCSSEQNSLKCPYALSRVFSKSWVATCQIGGASCIGQYIEVTFMHLAQPKMFCLSNRYDHVYKILTAKVEWSSGFNETISLPNDNNRHCFKYSNAPVLESGFKIIAKTSSHPKDIGFQYINVFAKKMDERVFTIQSNTDSIYHIPPHLNRNFRAMRLKFKGEDQGEAYDCSSLIISFKSKLSIQFILKLDEIIGNSKISSIHLTGPAIISKVLTNSEPLISCTKWNELWIELSTTDVKVGLGKTYGSSILAVVESSFCLEITQILFKNGNGYNIKNHIQISDKGIQFFNISHRSTFLLVNITIAEGSTLADNTNDCHINPYYETLDKSILTCVALAKRNNILEYKLTNGNGTITNYTFNEIIFKKTAPLSGNINVYFFFKTNNIETGSRRMCKAKPMLDKSSFLHFEFECHVDENLNLNSLFVSINIDDLTDVKKLFLCEVFIQN
ncbi:DgyrCDS14755 [Dimorphilus gyrociliatus]|uniref:DgyrCDS14755 n=1 Tax=Dimorphilus gyrociliatus TaxID=2664684 RepID=A0A7I8WES7_9ANNE|nr:DgyrCDS14755 [Dimorphilus gyrociliatus]